jgi:hypothetical protein
MQACGWESVQCAWGTDVVSRETLASRPERDVNDQIQNLAEQ